MLTDLDLDGLTKTVGRLAKERTLNLIPIAAGVIAFTAVKIASLSYLWLENATISAGIVATAMLVALILSRAYVFYNPQASDQGDRLRFLRNGRDLMVEDYDNTPLEFREPEAEFMKRISAINAEIQAEIINFKPQLDKPKAQQDAKLPPAK